MPYLISLILLLLPTYLLRFSIFNIPTTVLEILIYIVFIIGLFKTRRVGFRSVGKLVYLPIIALVVALLVSIFVVPDRQTALGEFKGFFIDPILVFWLIYQFIKPKDLQKIYWALIISGLFVAVDAIIQKYLGNVTPDGRVIGIFGYSPNYVSLYLAPITVLLFSQIYPFGDYEFDFGFMKFALRKYYGLAILVFLLIINCSGIYFSGSRGGVLAMAAGWGIFLLAHYFTWIRKHMSSQIIIAIIIIMAVYTSWTFFKPNFSASLDSGRVVTSNNLRWQIWEKSLEMIERHPILGIGLGNYQNAFGQFTKNIGNFPEYITPQALTSHNIYLMFWLSTGLLGLLSFLSLIVIFLGKISKINSPFKNPILAVMGAILIYGLIESSIWKNDLSIIFWTFWGLVWIL